MIQQGHRYKYQGREVLALESGEDEIRVSHIDESQPYPLGSAFMADAYYMEPLPMRYYYGAMPS